VILATQGALLTLVLAWEQFPTAKPLSFTPVAVHWAPAAWPRSINVAAFAERQNAANEAALIRKKADLIVSIFIVDTFLDY
jgi:hypothetical protein